MISLPKIGISFGSREAVKSIKGAAVAGVGASLYSALLSAGVMPDSLQSSDGMPYVVAGLSVVVNIVRQLMVKQSDSDY